MDLNRVVDFLFDQMMFGLRLGDNPKLVITTTPRPTKIITDLIDKKRNDVFVRTGATFDNAENLAESALQQLKEKYEDRVNFINIIEKPETTYILIIFTSSANSGEIFPIVLFFSSKIF